MTTTKFLQNIEFVAQQQSQTIIADQKRAAESIRGKVGPHRDASLWRLMACAYGGGDVGATAAMAATRPA